MIRVPDPDYTGSGRAQSNFLFAAVLGGAAVLLLWFIYALDQWMHFDLVSLGLAPRTVAGFGGIFLTPMLHASTEHLLSNSLPLFVGLTLMLYLFPNSAMRALPLIYVGSGVLAWVLAREAIHIGASGMVYGVLSFLFVSGVVRRDLRSMSVSLLVIFLYGFLIWGVFPFDAQMSWELHLAGALLGVTTAWHYRRWDQVPLKHYDWEDESDLDL